jgi:hypothetical protein
MQEVNVKNTSSIKLTKALLACGVVSTPLFFIVLIIQLFIRPGFNITYQPISLLSLGDLGWIQITNFIVTGLLVVICAVGIWRFLHTHGGGVWGPLLIGLYGVAFITAGIFHPDPGLGFPPGAPKGPPTTMSGHAIVHLIASLLALPSVIVASFVFARWFGSQGRRKWRLYSTATGVVSLLCIVLGIMLASTWGGVLTTIAGVFAYGLVSLISVHLNNELSKA